MEEILTKTKDGTFINKGLTFSLTLSGNQRNHFQNHSRQFTERLHFVSCLQTHCYQKRGSFSSEEWGIEWQMNYNNDWFPTQPMEETPRFSTTVKKSIWKRYHLLIVPMFMKSMKAGLKVEWNNSVEDSIFEVATVTLLNTHNSVGNCRYSITY
jgi:hypothetical protein